MNISIPIAVDATTLAVLGEIPKPILDIVLLETIGGTEASVRELATAEMRRQLWKERLELISVPTILVDANDTSGWCAGIAAAVEGGLPQPTFEATCPGLHAKYFRLADDANVETCAIREKNVVINTNLEELGETESLHFGNPDCPRSAPLARRYRLKQLCRWALMAVEGLGVIGISAAYVGILDYPSLSSVPSPLWSQAAMLAFPGMVAVFGIPYLIGRLTEKMSPSSFTLKAAAGFLVAVGLVYVVAFAGLRYVALQSGYDLTPRLEELGGYALLAILAIVLPVIAIIVEWLRRDVARLDRQIDEARRNESQFAGERGRLEAELAKLEARLRELEATIRAPEELRAAFEQGVAVLRQRIREEDEIVSLVTAKALACWRRTQDLSLPARRELHKRLYKLRKVEPTNGAGKPLNGQNSLDSWRTS